MGARDRFGERDEHESIVPAVQREYAFTRTDFDRVRRLIYARSGISLNASKENMVYSRLARRLRALSLTRFSDYLERLENDATFTRCEAQEFVNALTTNLTAFYREPHHFPILAEFLAQKRHAGHLRLWCAAAATGEEPYTIAITMHESLGVNHNARLLATDIDTGVLATAVRAVYPLDSARACGEERLRRNFLRGAGANLGMARVKPEIGRCVDFAQLNLLGDGWRALSEFSEQVDVIFCRNVMIYFDKRAQRRLLERFATVLRPGGLLFIGHSENLSDTRRFFVPCGKTVYARSSI